MPPKRKDALTWASPPAKKTRTQYIIFKSLVQSTPAGTALDGKGLTKLVKEEADKIKKHRGSSDYTKLWNQAREIERGEQKSLQDATTAWAGACCDEAVALLGSVAGSAADFTELEAACVKFTGASESIFSSGCPLEKQAQFQAALLAARTSLSLCKRAVSGERAVLVVAAITAVCGDAGATASTIAQLSAAADAARAWTASFRRDAEEAVVSSVAAAHSRVRAAILALHALEARTAADHLTSGVTAAIAQSQAVCDLGQRALALAAAAPAIEAWELRFSNFATEAVKRSVHAVKRDLDSALKRARDATADAALCATLASADQAALLAHAADFRDRAECIEQQNADLHELRQFKKEADRKEQLAAAQTASTAASLPTTVARALKSQMLYVQGLKHRSLNISYQQGGVTLDIFKAAFGASGSNHSVTASSLNINGKSLRYGASLEILGAVKLKLVGTQFTAQASYTMMC